MYVRCAVEQQSSGEPTVAGLIEHGLGDADALFDFRYETVRIFADLDQLCVFQRVKAPKP